MKGFRVLKLANDFKFDVVESALFTRDHYHLSIALFIQI